MHIAVVRELAEGERRVALTPDAAAKLIDAGHIAEAGRTERFQPLPVSEPDIVYAVIVHRVLG